MTDNVPAKPPACHLPWCSGDHARHPEHPEIIHTAFIADLSENRMTVEVIYRQHEHAGAMREPYLQVAYGPDWAVNDTLNIPLPVAASLGALLDLLTIHTYAEFGAALIRGAQGPLTPRSVQW
ncbi:hypothetical protein AB0K48_29565 [Nonomuraea sp. NPDC055795]